MSDERMRRLNRIADLAAIETARDLLSDAAMNVKCADCRGTGMGDPRHGDQLCKTCDGTGGGLRKPGETQAAAHLRIVASFDRECPRETTPIIGRADLQFAEMAAIEARRRNLAILALVGIVVAIVALAVAL